MEETDNICFVCDKTIPTDKWKYKLQVTATKKRNLPVADLIQQLVGDDCAVLVGERDAVCSRCMNLLNLMDSLTAQLEDVREMLILILHSKYNLASEDIQVEFDNSSPIDLEPLHKCSTCEFETKYEKEFNMHIRTHTSLHTTSPSADKIKTKLQKTKNTGKSNKNKIVKSPLSTSPKQKRQKKKQASVSKPKKKKIVFQCSVCDEIFSNETAIKSHAKRQHGNDHIFVTSDDEYADVQTLESSDEKMSENEVDRGILTPDNMKLDFLNDWTENSDDEISSPNKKVKTQEGFAADVPEAKIIGEKHRESFEEDYDNDSSSKPTCMFCHATFSSLESVQDHIKLSHGDQKSHLSLGAKRDTSSNASIASFEIDSTTDIAENKTKYNVSVGQQPTSLKSYKCKYCGIKKVSLKFIQNHIKLHKRKIALQCKLCGISFKNNVSLKIHASRCHKVAPSSTKCTYCIFKFFDHSQLKSHILKVHKKMFSLTCFGKEMSNINKTVGKLMPNAGEPKLKNTLTSRRFGANNTNKITSSASDITTISFSEVTSTSIENENSEKQGEKILSTSQNKINFTCKVCNLTFQRRCRLVDHLNKHKASKCLDLGICIFCDKLFMDKRQVIIHTSVEHENVETSAECPVCNKVYSLVKDMKTHYMRSHFNNKTEELMNKIMEYKIKQNDNLSDTQNRDSSDVYSKVFKELQDLTGEGADSEEFDLSEGGSKQVVPLSFNCPLCNFHSNDHVYLKNHFESHTKNYCNICKNVLGPEESIKHIENHSLEFEGKICPSCEHKFHDEIHLRCHIEIDHPGTRPFKCTMCEKTYRTEKSMLTHKQIQHGKRCKKMMSCTKCNMSFYSEKEHQTHTEFAHRSTLNCKYCDKSISDIKKLVIHERNHLKQVKSVFKCSVCGKVLKSHLALKTHKLNHMSGSSLNCDTCNKKFKSFHALREHSAKHSETQEKKYFCDICGKGFYFYDSHYRHRRIHLDPLLYQCKSCRARFQTKQKLIDHSQICAVRDSSVKI